jgi:hypothetical protein
MALSQKHRSSLFRSLTPIVGEEETEALLSQFPANDLEAPATSDFVRAEVSSLRAEMHEGFNSLRAEMHEGLSVLRAELHAVENSLRGDINALRVEVNVELRRMTVWFAGALVGSVVGGMGFAVGIASLV